MILVADSGSTKTHWRLVDTEVKIYSFSTLGFNPFFWKSEDIVKEIRKNLPANIKQHAKDVKEIFFYGAGCSSPSRNKIISSSLKRIFPKSKIEVHHDLLASARALCGDHEGIACILGTGSNSCYYDGKKITESFGGLGHTLGDEGSGKQIGKKLLQAYLNKSLPQNVSKTFEREYRLSKEKILDSVYKKQHPNKYMASFTKFISDNIQEPSLRAIVKDSFLEFFTKYISKYKKHKQVPVGCVGSIGFYFHDILREVAIENHVRLEKIIESPINELVKYHLNKKK